MGKKILALDLGISSVGWAMVNEEAGGASILGLGSRIIPLSVDDSNEFSTGNAISKNAKRTQKRTQRKGYDRYQLRRQNLISFLEQHGLMPAQELMQLPPLSLWSLRERAATEKIAAAELGRVLYHLNQKRGYRSSRADESADKKETQYVAEVMSRYAQLKESGLTLGQHFFKALREAHDRNQPYRIKQQVYPRQAYLDEFDSIVTEQRKHHSFLINENIASLRNHIIYYQRPLKSQKGLVSICEFEGKYRKNAKGNEIFTGPKVAPRSSPLAQVGKIWETINNIRLTNKRGEVYATTPEQKTALANYLNQNERMSQVKLFELLHLKSGDGWIGNKQTGKGLQGNLTRCAITALLPTDHPALRFDLPINSKPEEVYVVDAKTGEIKQGTIRKTVDHSFERQPFYRLWHAIYSIADIDECASVLQRAFNINEQTALRLARLDFTKGGFSNKSAAALRKILPYLMDGFGYSDAMSLAGYNHSASLTKDENLKRQLLNRVPLLKKNSLRQPVVEKILNQMIGVVNEAMDKWSRPDEIRIELARELKQSKEERNETFAALNKREKENQVIRKRIETEYGGYGVRATRNTLIKWRLFHEINNDEVKTNATCIYCGQPFGITEALRGGSVDVEHIIPRSKLFDDSQSNKTLVHRTCNDIKGDRTAYDYMAAKSATELAHYLDRVDALYKSKIIGKRKRDNFIRSEKDIPKDFIERQLRETQYISRKAKEILEQVCYNVWSTSGSVTEYLRRTWGWNGVLMNLHLPKAREAGQTEWVEKMNEAGQLHQVEVIKGWTKRDDYRHHAVDALTIACTQQGFIQRINTLNAAKTREAMRAELNGGYDVRKNLLENYIFSKRPFTTAQVEEAVSKVLVSFKPGKRVATVSKYKARGKNAESGVIVPRGALSEESVYGRIQTIEKGKPVKYLFENPHLIFKPYIKALVEERLAAYNGDAKKSLASLKKEPIYLDEAKTISLQYGTCYRTEYVIKYPLASLLPKDVPFIIDPHMRDLIIQRFAEYKGAEKKAFEKPLYSNEATQTEIRSVRCATGLTAVESVKKDEEGNNIGFVKPGNNHHLAIYADTEGNKIEHICSFWHAVERKKFGFPPIITNPQEAWDTILPKADEYPQSFLQKLPEAQWVFQQSMQQNEMFLVGLTSAAAAEAIAANDFASLSKHLYRAQKISSTGYKLVLRHHLATTIDRDADMRGYASPSKFDGIKVRIGKIGDIRLAEPKAK